MLVYVCAHILIFSINWSDTSLEWVLYRYVIRTKPFSLGLLYSVPGNDINRQTGANLVKIINFSPKKLIISSN